MKRVWCLILAAGLLVLLPGCSDEGGPVSVGAPDREAAVSFVNDVQPIFDANCIGCHGAGGNGGLDLRSPQSHGNLVDATSPSYGARRVVPGVPDESVLVDKVAGGGRFGGTMPPVGAGLSAAQIQTIRTWVLEGAEEN